MKRNNLIITISLLLITNFVSAQLIYGIYNEEQIERAKCLKDIGGSEYETTYNHLITSAEYFSNNFTPRARTQGIRHIGGDCSSNAMNDIGNDMNENAQMMHTLALAYLLSDEVSYGNKAIEFLDAWVNTTTGINAYSDCGNFQPDQAFGRRTPSFIETAFLLRNTDIWINHPSIDIDFRNYLQNIIVPNIAHGATGGDMNNGNFPAKNNHSGPAIITGFMANIYLDSGQEEWDNVMAALEWRLDVVASNYGFNSGMTSMVQGIQCSTQFGDGGGYIVRDLEAVFPLEMYRGGHSNRYSKLAITNLNQMFRFIHNAKGINKWTWINNDGVTFENVLQSYFDMRIGGPLVWGASTDIGPSYNTQGWKQLYETAGKRLNNSEWDTWATQGAPLDLTVSIYDVNWTLLPSLFPIESNECGDCSGEAVSNIYVTTEETDTAGQYIVTITWDGNPNADVWVYVHEDDTTGSHHLATGNSYTFPVLLANYTFTVYVQGEHNCDEPASMEFSTFNNTASTNSNSLNAIAIYPNPATNTLYISQNQEEIKNYIIVNLLGKQVASGNLVNGTIDISQLEKGIYFIKLSTSDNFVNKQFIKN